jgi:hypothetical protein
MGEQKTEKRRCPLCKGKIRSDAVRCKHCAADLSKDAPCGCEEEHGKADSTSRSAPTSERKLIPRRAEGTRVLHRSADEGCNDYEVDDEGTWCFVESSEHYCIYEKC